jgi:hypothetical protein
VLSSKANFIWSKLSGMKLPIGLAILVSTAAIIAAHFQAGVAVAHTTLERVDLSSQSDLNQQFQIRL